MNKGIFQNVQLFFKGVTRKYLTSKQHNERIALMYTWGPPTGGKHKFASYGSRQREQAVWILTLVQFFTRVTPALQWCPYWECKWPARSTRPECNTRHTSRAVAMAEMPSPYYKFTIKIILTINRMWRNKCLNAVAYGGIWNKCANQPNVACPIAKITARGNI